MLATPTPTPGVPPSGPEWIHEVKWDGVRAIAETHDGRLHLYSRNEGEITAAYPDLVAGAVGLPDGLIIDGEIIAIDPIAGVPTLQGIAPRIHVRDADRAARLATERPATFVAFDLMAAEGQGLTRRPLSERRQLLEGLDLDRPGWQLSVTYDDPGIITELTREAGLEGVMSKLRDSLYLPGTRSPNWRKTPHRSELVAVIGGWVPETGAADRLGSVWVGHAHDEKGFDDDPVLYPLGRVGSGLPATERDLLLSVLRGIERDDAPFERLPPDHDTRNVRWVDPIICVQVRYLSMSSNGLLRQPVLRALRPDVRPVDAATATLLTPGSKVAP